MQLLKVNKSISEKSIVKEEHSKYFKKSDLIIFDRGYASYELFALFFHKYKSNFLIAETKVSIKSKSILLFFMGSFILKLKL